MKLQHLLYEAAKTAEEANEKQVAAIKIRNNIILFSTKRFIKAVDRHLEAADLSEVQYNMMDKLTDSLSKDCIVGQVSFTNIIPGVLSMVGSSSGVNKFGPLVYEIVMQSIYPAYLRSDSSLKEGSRNVWNKMYQRGDVEKKWVGSFGGSPAASYDNLESSIVSIPRNEKPANDGVTITKGTKELLKIYLNNIHPTAPTEDVFLDFLRDNNIDINDHGNFYAYRTTTGNTGPVKTMFDLGDQMKEYMITKLEATSDAVSEAFRVGSNKHFSRMYKSYG
jgi:hypothetical protein